MPGLRQPCAAHVGEQVGPVDEVAGLLGVDVEEVPGLAYSCVGLVRPSTGGEA